MKRAQQNGRRGVTLVELLMALSILGIMSTAILYLILASTNINRYTRDETTGMWDADFAWHRLYANTMAAVPSANGGMMPTVTTDANGQSHLTLIVPDVANNTTRTVQYYCTGASAPFNLVEDDPRYNVGGTPSPIAYKVQSFTAALDSTTTLKVWFDLKVTPTGGWTVRRHFCTQCRNF